jgi:hypothetical protein
VVIFLVFGNGFDEENIYCFSTALRELERACANCTPSCFLFHVFEMERRIQFMPVVGVSQFCVLLLVRCELECNRSQPRLFQKFVFGNISVPLMRIEDAAILPLR